MALRAVTGNVDKQQNWRNIDFLLRDTSKFLALAIRSNVLFLIFHHAKDLVHIFFHR